MRDAKLFNALVLGGGLLAAGCGAPVSKTTTDTKSKAESPPPPTSGPGDSAAKDLKCEEVCNETGGVQACPDPQTGMMNCCWLMMGKGHPCCR